MGGCVVNWLADLTHKKTTTYQTNTFHNYTHPRNVIKLHTQVRHPTGDWKHHWKHGGDNMSGDIEFNICSTSSCVAT